MIYAYALTEEYPRLETGIDILFGFVDKIEIRYDSLTAVHRVSLKIKLAVDKD